LGRVYISTGKVESEKVTNCRKIQSASLRKAKRTKPDRPIRALASAEKKIARRRERGWSKKGEKNFLYKRH